RNLIAARTSSATILNCLRGCWPLRVKGGAALARRSGVCQLTPPRDPKSLKEWIDDGEHDDRRRVPGHADRESRPHAGDPSGEARMTFDRLSNDAPVTPSDPAPAASDASDAGNDAIGKTQAEALV